MNNYCVYTHSHNGKIFYVGMGSIKRARTYPEGRSKAWLDFYYKVANEDIKVNTVSSWLSREEALMKESILIREIGLNNLTNVTRGTDIYRLPIESHSNNQQWYLRIFNSNFFCNRHVLEFNRRLNRNLNLSNGIFIYLNLSMLAVEEFSSNSIDYDLNLIDIYTGYNDLTLTTEYINLLIKCDLAKINNNKLVLTLAESSIISQEKYQDQDIDSIPF